MITLREQSRALAVRDQTHALFSEQFSELVQFCISERFTVGELAHLSKSSSACLYARPVLVVVVWLER